MEKDYKMVYTTEDLKTMQNWSLDKKIQVTQTRIIEWYQYWKGNIYISFSGGKDSTVLLDIARKIYPDILAVFVDTGLEYPEIKQFVNSKSNVEIIRPKYTFRQVIEKYGYPIFSKSVACSIDRFRLNPNEKWRYNKFINGINKDGTKTKYMIPKKYQKVALENKFKISDKCCDRLKGDPLIKFERKSGLHAVIGNMATESYKRTLTYRKTGCNSFEAHRPISNPLGFWTENDILEYIVKYKLEYCPIYGDILRNEAQKLYLTGYQRTGCVYCGFGCNLNNPNKFQMLKQTHPQLYDYCMKPFDEGGLGMKFVLECIGVEY